MTPREERRSRCDAKRRALFATMLRLKRVEAAPCPSERCTEWARMAGVLNLQEASEEEKLPRRWDDAILGAVIGDKKQKTRLNLSRRPTVQCTASP